MDSGDWVPQRKKASLNKIGIFLRDEGSIMKNSTAYKKYNNELSCFKIFKRWKKEVELPCSVQEGL